MRSLRGVARAVRQRVVDAAPRFGREIPRPPAAPLTDEPRPDLIPTELLPARPRSCVVVAGDVTADVQAYLDQLGRRPTTLLIPTAAAEPELRPEWPITLTRADTLDDVHDLLVRHGPVGILVLARPTATSETTRLLTQLYLHVAKNGALVVDLEQTRRRPAEATSSPGPRGAPSWHRGLELLLAAQEGQPPETTSAWEKELVSITDRIVVDQRFAVLRKKYHHLVKLRSDVAVEVLATREPALVTETLATAPAGTLESATRVTSHPADAPVHDLQTTFDYPELPLRRYTGRVALVRNGLVFSRQAVLPDSFRHHLRADLVNGRIVGPTTSDFGRIARHHWPSDGLAGTYFNVDSENSGHFGHLTTEVVSRLWGWDQAKREHPDLKAIMRIRYPGEREPVLERRILGAFGIDPADLVVVDHPVNLESLVSAMPMFHNARPHYVHPDLPAVWRRIGDGLVASRPPVEVGDVSRVFVSRKDTLGARPCRNAAAVEQLFIEHGFTVLYPEDVDLATQATIFSAARFVAGFGGSGMFNTMYGRALEQVIVLNQWAYDARNEHLIACALGADLHYFWSRPDVEQPPGGWTWRAYRSAWEFDFATNEAPLRDLLTGLPD